jgi:hypothetical protein
MELWSHGVRVTVLPVGAALSNFDEPEAFQQGWPRFAVASKLLTEGPS